MTALHKTVEEWSKILPDAVMDGSRAQGVNVLTMALEDIEVMGARISYLEASMTQIRDTLPHQNDVYARHVFSVAADALETSG